MPCVRLFSSYSKIYERRVHIIHSYRVLTCVTPKVLFCIFTGIDEGWLFGESREKILKIIFIIFVSYFKCAVMSIKGLRVN